MKYNPTKNIGKNINSEFLLFLLKINNNSSKIKLTINNEKDFRKFNRLIEKLDEINEIYGTHRKLYNDTKIGVNLGSLHGFGIYYKFEEAFKYKLIDILEFDIIYYSYDFIEKNNPDRKLLKTIIFDSDTSIMGDLLEYNKSPYIIETIYKHNSNNINIFLKKYLALWRKDYFQKQDENYLLSGNHLKEYYKYIGGLIENYGKKGVKILISSIKELNFDIICCLIYEHFNGKINMNPINLDSKYIAIDILKEENKSELKNKNIVYLNHNIQYNKKTHVFKNNTNNNECEIPEKYFTFMDILVKNIGKRVKYEDIQKVIGNDPYLTNGTYKSNLKKALLRDKVLFTKQEIIKGKNKGYILEIQEKEK